VVALGQQSGHRGNGSLLVKADQSWAGRVTEVCVRPSLMGHVYHVPNMQEAGRMLATGAHDVVIGDQDQLGTAHPEFLGRLSFASSKDPFVLLSGVDHDCNHRLHAGDESCYCMPGPGEHLGSLPIRAPSAIEIQRSPRVPAQVTKSVQLPDARRLTSCHETGSDALE
jgi:hypothetical protein